MDLGGGDPMAGYVDLYMLPVPRRNLPAYRKLAKAWGKIMRDHGVLEYREFVAKDSTLMKGMPPVAKLVKPKRGEVTVSSVVGFRNKAHHDRVNGAAMKDPRMKALMESKPLFDMKRMHIGEFETFVAG